MNKLLTINKYLETNEIDLEGEELKEELSDNFKTGKNFLKIYRLLRNDVDLSEYEKVFNELRSLEYDTDRPLIIGKEKAIRCFNNYVDGEPLVYRLVREVCNEVA